jgi:DNA repair photolyase
MKVKEIQAKTCMTKSKLTDYVINPYTGCSHGCRYCYADFIKRFQNIPDNWGEFVFAKINCPELLKEEIEKNKPGHIWLSSVCDCYMPEEEKFKLTRRILEISVNSNKKDKFTFEILTKSALVRRDFDLLKKLNVELGMSINQLDEKIAKVIEPFASSPMERIETLKLAKQQGIKTFGFISPVLPGIADLEGVFRELSKAGVDYVWVELFNMRKSAC